MVRPRSVFAVLMPVFDEGTRLDATLAELEAIADDAHITVFLVDDGSDPPIVPQRATSRLRVVLARHPVNLGQGAALETARRLALDPRWSNVPFDAIVTMDSDGQHRAEDALALARAVQEGADVALGDRFAGGSLVPPSRRALLGAARIFERFATGLRLSDAHNGLRAFSPRALAAVRIRQNRMAHATELTRRIADAKLRVVEVPVSVRYTEAVLAKGQSASGAVAIVSDLFRTFLFGE